MDKNNYDLMVKLKKEFEKKVLEIIEIIVETENKRFIINEMESIDYNEEEIYIIFEESYCGGYDGYSFSFPINYLFNDDWMIDYKEKIRLKNEAKKIKKEQEMQLLIELTEQKELEMLKN